MTRAAGGLYPSRGPGHEVLGCIGADRSLVVWEARTWRPVDRRIHCVKYEAHTLHFSTVHPHHCYMSGLDYEVFCGERLRPARRVFCVTGSPALHGIFFFNFPKSTCSLGPLPPGAWNRDLESGPTFSRKGGGNRTGLDPTAHCAAAATTPASGPDDGDEVGGAGVSRPRADATAQGPTCGAGASAGPGRLVVPRRQPLGRGLSGANQRLAGGLQQHRPRVLLQGSAESTRGGYRIERLNVMHCARGVAGWPPSAAGPRS